MAESFSHALEQGYYVSRSPQSGPADTPAQMLHYILRDAYHRNGELESCGTAKLLILRVDPEVPIQLAEPLRLMLVRWAQWRFVTESRNETDPGRYRRPR